MKNTAKPETLSLFHDQIGNIILSESEGIYQINNTTHQYKALKSSPLLDSVLGSEGTYEFFFNQLTVRGSSGKAASPYESFIDMGRPLSSIYTRRVQIHDTDGVSSEYMYIYYPCLKAESSYIVLSPIQDFSQHSNMREAKARALAEGYLYSMLVDLDEDDCSNTYVTELNLPDQEPIKLSYTDWRKAIAPCINPEYETLFLDRTHPVNVRTILQNDSRFFFDVQMQNLTGEWVWTRHTAFRVLDETDDHLVFIYTVQDIDKDKRSLLLQMNMQKTPDDAEEASQDLSGDSADPSPDTENTKRISSLSTFILNQVEQEICSNYMDKLSLTQMAHKYFINSAYLGQLFIRRYGKTFHEYLNAKRMENAVRLLTTTNYSIHTIIEMVGISSTHYFNRLFRKYYGCTPTAYRKKHRFSM